MRVRGSVSPEALSIMAYPWKDGYVEARLRENVKFVEVEYDGRKVKEYSYDEYMFILPDKPNLRQEIEANFGSWLQTGRNLEVNNSASSIQDMLDGLGNLGDLTPLVKKQGDAITEMQTAFAEMFETENSEGVEQ